jgi:TfoX/Sxy family transcriptional regulator of competence genes
MATAKKKAIPNEKVELYGQLVAAHPGMVRKGAANPYTAVNGNMFTLLHQSERMAIRLPEEERAEFLKKYKTRLFEAYGTVMPEYVAVPDALLKKPKELEKWVGVSFAYAKGLKAKAKKKKE